MAKKFKAKVVRKEEEFNDHGQTMMTEQEEKMFYTNKKMSLENGHIGHIKKKHTTTNSSNYMQNSQNDDEQYENIEHLELSNLNQTSAEEITEFINKLITKNKVTSRNAFDIPLIHLEQMEDFRSSLNQNTWKRLSSTLENDYKIYGYRVDAAHTITYKMVQSIARHQAAGEEQKIIGNHGINKAGENAKTKGGTTNNELLNSFMESSFNQNLSKNKMNVDYTKFIQKNQKLINVTHIQAFFGCNPGLEKTKRKFDQQGFKALLLNNIALRNGCELKLDEHQRHDLEDNDQTKKQNIENNQIETQIDENFELQQILQQVFTDEIRENKIQIQKCQFEQSVFEKIHQLNINECKSNADEFKKFQKLYKIISGQDKEEKRQIKNKQMSMPTQIMVVEQQNEILEEKIEKSANFNDQIDENNLVTSQNDQNSLQKEGIINNQIEKVQEQVPQQNQIRNEQTQSRTDNIKISSTVQNTRAILNFPSLSELQNKSNKNRNQFQINKHQQISNVILQIVPKTVQLQKYPDPNQQNSQNQDESHILFDKNFQMRELNVQQMEQSQSIQSSKQLNIFTGKLKNIQEYIKIKQPKVKRQKKIKILIDDMTSQEIGKKLFNKNYRKKKNDSIKQQHSIKEETDNQQTKKKVDFNKITKPSNDLKRSLIFKKSVTQERTFHLIKQKLKKKLEERQKVVQNEQNENIDNKKKGKKTLKIFDLPTYQFQQGDLNFLEPYEQIDPQTNQLEFSYFCKDHFSSFVESSCTIIEEIRKRKQDRQKEKKLREIAKMKEIEQNQQQQKLMEERFDIEQENPKPQVNNQINTNNIQRHDDQQNDDLQPDISFIYDEMGHLRGKHQVAIRDAKQKVKTIILQMFYNLKSRKNNGKKHKKISFKEIYQAYYRRQGFISPALCFLTILHLANQHNLILQGKQNGTDFKIFVEEDNQFNSQLKRNEFIMEIEPIMDDEKGIDNSFIKSFSSATKEEKVLDIIIEE